MPTESDYREEARQARDRAAVLLAAPGGPSVRYAALELRTAIEALVLGQAATFQDEMGESYLDKWNPREMLQHLRTIDPMVDKAVSLAVSIDGENDFQNLGASRPITFSELGKLHNSLGFFLHAPTLAQMSKGGWFNEEAARKRCVAAAEIVAQALAATLSAMKLNFASYKFNCERCGTLNHAMNVKAGEHRMWPCINCKAPYVVEDRDGGAKLAAFRIPVRCAAKDCTHTAKIWADEIRAASTLLGERHEPFEWTCDADHHNRFVLRLSHVTERITNPAPA